jgi:RNase P subunit RPR2
MIKYYCDRCNQFFDISSKEKTEYRIYKAHSSQLLNLCNKCQKELDNWMRNKETKSNNPAKDVKSPSLSVKKIFG